MVEAKFTSLHFPLQRKFCPLSCLFSPQERLRLSRGPHIHRSDAKIPRLLTGDVCSLIYTSWMIAISAASPRRGPIFSTRV